MHDPPSPVIGNILKEAPREGLGGPLGEKLLGTWIWRGDMGNEWISKVEGCDINIRQKSPHTPIPPQLQAPGDAGALKEVYVPKFASSASSISIFESGRAGALSTRVAEAIAVWMELKTRTQWQAQHQPPLCKCRHLSGPRVLFTPLPGTKNSLDIRQSFSYTP